ncbi:HAMP domain-containing histidine kinase [Streptomyces sp. PTM05]|uniref:histidine kinase n=1 Tax=Streptantibioticus parmotrematis TaxID=2873249 RepID=A0ABS7QQN8_9ACTN|nr:HAMP domain-containing sensor histidine kinase [Streptantibioticus parmotrematis]MBY8885061.1 HAMP domain-containing histidine kinase [Streptantibioticus parmotrematis]
MTEAPSHRSPTGLRRLWRFRTLPLRSRLAILTAAAVAVAVGAVAVSAWFITRSALTDRLDSSLKGSYHQAEAFAVRRGGCVPGTQPKGDQEQRLYLGSTAQVVGPDGTTCQLWGYLVKPQAVDRAIAAGQRPSAFHDSTDSNGTKVRVYTEFDPKFTTNESQGLTISVAQPLNQVTDPLAELALILSIVAGIGVLGAATAGLVIARAGLRPVDRLTDAVEHIAKTEDLAIRIPVEGEDEIARLSASFNSMTAQLAASRDRQQQLIADAGHELRTPLTSLRTNIELLARSEETGRPLPPEDRKALLASVKAQMSELALLIGDLQELSRPDAAPGSGPLQEVAVHEVAEHAVQRARLRGPDLRINAELAPWYLQAEPASMERALVNLLDNAVKFSPSGGEIDVRLVRGEFSVRDHGPGIPAEDLPHVFDRFWRSPSARSLPGSGLGLSIVARTIQQVGGAVALHAAHGGGTVAVIRLPGTPEPRELA